MARSIVTVKADDPTELVDKIVPYVKRGYALVDIWYRKKYWLWGYTYYAQLIALKATLDIVIGPVSTRAMPKLVLKIGPISQREVSHVRAD